MFISLTSHSFIDHSLNTATNFIANFIANKHPEMQQVSKAGTVPVFVATVEEEVRQTNIWSRSFERIIRALPRIKTGWCDRLSRGYLPSGSCKRNLNCDLSGKEDTSVQGSRGSTFQLLRVQRPSRRHNQHCVLTEQKQLSAAGAQCSHLCGDSLWKQQRPRSAHSFPFLVPRIIPAVFSPTIFLFL